MQRHVRNIYTEEFADLSPFLYSRLAMKKAQWNSAEAILLTAKLERTAESASQMNGMLQSYIVGAIHQISF